MWKKIHPTKPEKLAAPEYCRTVSRCLADLPGNQGYYIGVDPGVNFGITLVQDEKIEIYYGSLNKCEKPGEYAALAYQFFSSLFHASPRFYSYKRCIIEGAAYHKAFGQVGLAEIRIGFYLCAYFRADRLQDYPSIVPPATIRKKVFGNATQQAGEYWPTLNHNAADSIAIALYGLL